MANRSGAWNGLALAGGRYVVNARLGAGGMGAVYRALDRNLDTDVVIKVPHRTMLDDPAFAARFTREIRSLVKLSHPRIVKVTDVGDWDDSPFAVMQYLPGGSLEDRQHFEPDGHALPCDPREVPKWLIGIAQALDYVHSQGYIHRDVKPGNILFDAQGHSFLSDFGVAKALSESAESGPSRSVTGAGKVLGTPEYMAPELIMGEKIDGRVDQYALAITVYELLCGRRPFEGEGDVKTKVLVLHTTTPPPPLSAWQPGLTGKLSETVLKGLAKDPNGRYLNCTALAAAVVAAVKELPARQDERVRVQCPNCGKGLAVLAAELPKLRQSGRRIPCPACQHPVPLSGDPAGTPRDGTLIVNAPGGSGGFPVAPAGTPRSGTMIVPGADAAPAPVAKVDRSGTMIVPGPGATPPGAAAAQRGGTTVVPSPGAAPAGTPRSGTRIVDQPQQPDARPVRRGTMIVDNAESAGGYALAADDDRDPRRLVPVPVSPAAGGRTQLVAIPLNQPEPSAARAAQAPAPVPPLAWIAGGVGAGVALISGVAFFALAPRGGGEPKPAVATTPAGPRATPAPSAKESARVVPVFPRRAAEATPVATTSPPPPEPVSTPAPVAVATGDPTVAASPTLGMLKPPGPVTTDAVGPPTAAEPRTPEPTPEPANPGPGLTLAEASPINGPRPTAPREEWSPAIAAKRPTRARDTLDKILSSTARYQNQVVVPEGMYCLEETLRTLPSGGVQIGLNQSRLELTRGNPSVRTLKAIDLEIEPKLVDTLREARQESRDDLGILPAIVTVWVTSRGECRLVAAEFLVRFQPRFNPNGLPDVDYYTLKVTPDGSSPGKAKDEDWETIPRMLNIKNVCERQLKAIKNAKSGMKQAAIDKQMNSMFSTMMKSAVVQNARDEAMLERMRNPRPR